MKNSLIILLLFTSVLHAQERQGGSYTLGTAILPGQIDKDGFVTLTKKGQRASYYIVGGHMHTGGLVGELSADNEGIAEMIVLYPDRPTDVDGNDLSYCWRVLLHKDAKLRFIEPVKEQDGSAKTDVGGHLIIESSGIKTIFLDSWPPSDIYRERGKSSPKKAPSALIIKSLDPLVRSGKIKIKKPPLTPEQRAERARRLLEAGAGFIDSNNSSDRPSDKAEAEDSDERK